MKKIYNIFKFAVLYAILILSSYGLSSLCVFITGFANNNSSGVIYLSSIALHLLVTGLYLLYSAIFFFFLFFMIKAAATEEIKNRPLFYILNGVFFLIMILIYNLTFFLLPMLRLEELLKTAHMLTIPAACLICLGILAKRYELKPLFHE